MKIVPIFEFPKNIIYAIRLVEGNPDAFTQAFRNWSDIEFLEDFFESNKSDLQSGHFGKISVEEAVNKTIDDAAFFEEEIKRQINRGKKNNEPRLPKFIFKPLSEKEKAEFYEADKAYGVYSDSWLRLYAVKIDENTFVVTGSAIKLTRAMQERKHTQLELNRLRQVVKWLRENGITSDDDFGILEIEES